MNNVTHRLFTTLRNRILRKTTTQKTAQQPATRKTFKLFLPAGTLLSDDDIQEKAPFICAAYGGKFTGVWRIVIPGEMSVVECEIPYTPNKEIKFALGIPALPI
ncbi:MAG: mannan-binding protein [Breznakibacter sp.]